LGAVADSTEAARMLRLSAESSVLPMWIGRFGFDRCMPLSITTKKIVKQKRNTSLVRRG
jgi:hypothetical protein